MNMLLIELFVVALSNLNLACFQSFQSNFVNFMNLGTEKIKPKTAIKQAFKLYGVLDSSENLKKNCGSFPKSSARKHVCTRFCRHFERIHVLCCFSVSLTIKNTWLYIHRKSFHMCLFSAMCQAFYVIHYQIKQVLLYFANEEAVEG